MATFRGTCPHCSEETYAGQYSIEPKCHVCKGSLLTKPNKTAGVSIKLNKEEEEVVELPSGDQNKKLAS